MAKVKRINREAAQKRMGPGISGDWFKPGKDQPYIMQVVGPVGEMESPWIEQHQHACKPHGSWKNSGFAGDGGPIWGLTCISEHAGDPCPACDIDAYLDDNDLVDILTLQAGVRGLMNVIMDGTPMIWAAPVTVVRRLQSFYQRYGDDLFDPEIGYAFDVILANEGGNRWRYTVDLRPDRRPAASGWEKKAVDLHELIRPMTQDVMLEILYRTLKDSTDPVVPFREIFGTQRMKALEGTSLKRSPGKPKEKASSPKRSLGKKKKKR
jgi:hypothetical protein